MMAINMSSDWRLTRLTMGGVRALGWGHSVTMASAHWLVASLFKLACVMAKHAIVGLPKTAALGGHGVTCNAICPSHVLTPLEELQIPETAKARGMTDEQVNRDVMLAAQPTREFTTVGAACRSHGVSMLGRRGKHDRRRTACRWWLDGPLRRKVTRIMSMMRRTKSQRGVNLALQGGGSYSAFTWGLRHMFDTGRTAATDWLEHCFDHIGVQSKIDLAQMMTGAATAPHAGACAQKLTAKA